jgi:tetratricopeptide (TPR) repeat protein
MSLSIICPRCQASLKASKLPSEPKNVVCPECKHSFQVTPAGITADLPRPAPVIAAEPEPVALPPVARAAFNWLGAGIIGAILLVGAGVIAAIVLTRTTSNDTDPMPADLVSQKEPVVETDRDVEPDKRRQDFIRLMIEGGTSFNAQRLDDALAAYTEAVKLFPDDADVRQKLSETQSALAKQHQARDEEQKTREDALKLVKQGREALEQKKYAAAVDFFKLALQKEAGNSEASSGLLAAQDGLNREQLDHKKLSEYENLIASGKAALKGARFADAIRDFIAAQRVVPNDMVAAQLQREAEKQLDGINNRAERQKELQRLLDLANTALRSKQWEEAEKTFQRALQLAPTDAAAQKGLAEAQKAAKLANAEFATWMLRGNAALQNGRLAEAVLAFREATRILPDNDTASRALRQTELLQEAQQVYFRAMERASNAMALKQYGDAVVAYNEALRAAPGDLAALQGLQDAQRLFEGDARKRKDFDRKAFAGLQLLKAQKYSEAAVELRGALRILPHHPQAALVERQLRYAEAMADGIQALNARRWQDAIRQFQAALSEYPNDFAARNALAKARSGAKGGA